MTQLKTLKDIDLIYFAESGYEGSSYVNETELKQELRQEAIKWIKSEEIIIDTTHSRSKFYEDITCAKIKAIQSAWIKYFFNITEEDLK